MSLKPKFYGTITNGKFIHDDPDKFHEHLQSFKEGQNVEITIAPKYKRRTSGQQGERSNFNGYYWAVIVRIISDTMGEIDDNVTHNLLQQIFNKKGVRVIDPYTKKEINVEVARGTKHLSGAEFAEYCSKIRTWASIPDNLSEHGVFIPEPNECEYDENGG